MTAELIHGAVVHRKGVGPQFDAQIHTTKHLPPGTGPGTVQEYVENGQLLLLRVVNWHAVYGS